MCTNSTMCNSELTAICEHFPFKSVLLSCVLDDCNNKLSFLARSPSTRHDYTVSLRNMNLGQSRVTHFKKACFFKIIPESPFCDRRWWRWTAFFRLKIEIFQYKKRMPEDRVHQHSSVYVESMTRMRNLFNSTISSTNSLLHLPIRNFFLRLHVLDNRPFLFSQLFCYFLVSIEKIHDSYL